MLPWDSNIAIKLILSYSVRQYNPTLRTDLFYTNNCIINHGASDSSIHPPGKSGLFFSFFETSGLFFSIFKNRLKVHIIFHQKYSTRFIKDISKDMPCGTAAGLLLIEHLWAKKFKETAMKKHGVLLVNTFISPEALVSLGTELAEGARNAGKALDYYELQGGVCG